MEEKILVAEDERCIADPIVYAFRREGFQVEVAYDGIDAYNKINEFRPLIVLLDINMPKMSGIEIIKKLNNRQRMGIIFLTAKNDIVDKVLGLELGADDYITKPFDIREVVARVNSLVRRIMDKIEEQNTPKDDILKFDALQICYSKRKVTIDDQAIELTPKEFDLLYLLFSNLERVYSRDKLMDTIWGMDYLGGTRTVDMHILRLRKKLGSKYEDMIQTMHRVGYRALGGA